MMLRAAVLCLGISASALLGAAPPSSTDGPGYKVLVSTLRQLFPDAVPVPGIVNGATDSRHFQSLAQDVYRFVPRVLVKTDLKRIHGTDERVGVSDMALEVRAYRRIVREGSQLRAP